MFSGIKSFQFKLLDRLPEVEIIFNDTGWQPAVAMGTEAD
jgi:hypothetical protein